MGGWRKSTLSMSNGHCVEAAACPDGHILVRDSKDPGGPVLSLTRPAWDRFLADIKRYACYAAF